MEIWDAEKNVICQSKCSFNVAFTVANAKTALTLTNLA